MAVEDNERLIREFASASAAIHKSVGGKHGDGAEKVYGQAYQALVRAGLKPKLRGKYT